MQITHEVRYRGDQGEDSPGYWLGKSGRRWYIKHMPDAYEVSDNCHPVWVVISRDEKDDLLNDADHDGSTITVRKLCARRGAA